MPSAFLASLTLSEPLTLRLFLRLLGQRSRHPIECLFRARWRQCPPVTTVRRLHPHAVEVCPLADLAGARSGILRRTDLANIDWVPMAAEHANVERLAKSAVSFFLHWPSP